MPSVPFIGRLSVREYVVVFSSFILIFLEGLLHIIISLLPRPVINWFYLRSRSLFNALAGPAKIKTKERLNANKILNAPDFEALCRFHGYTHEEHVVLTKDGYLLGLHRIPCKKGEQKTSPGTSTGKPVVYLHHGLLMNSEVWVALTDADRAIPFVLAERGYDVWLGNNRGNKYSKKSIHHSPNSAKFWDYSIDDFAWHDIPDSIDYILSTTKEKSLSYIGFSQGTAQAFAALSIHPQLNDKVNVFIALAPAMSPAGLSASVVDALMKASPTIIYLIFGRKAILSSAPMWQSILYPPIFTRLIDISLRWLFSWRSVNISPAQKIAAYAHLYSFASTKSVVHWFQIMRNGAFQMFDDDVDHAGGALRRSMAYRPVRFPTKNIVTPIVLLYGDVDSLVDMHVMTNSLPKHTIVKRLRGYEHLDIIWGKQIHIDVIPHVLDALEEKRDKTRPSQPTFEVQTNKDGYPSDGATDVDLRV